MLDQLNREAAQAVELAQESGADDAWVTAQRTRSTEFTYRDDALEKVQESASHSLSFALYVDGRYSTHSTNDLEPENLRSFVAEAVALTRALEVDADRLIPDPVLFEGRPSDPLELIDGTLGELDGATREAWCAEIATSANAHEKVISVTSSVSDHHGQVAFASSNGFSGAKEGTSVWLGVETTLHDGDRRPEGYYWVGARHREDLPNVATIGANGLARAIARLGAIQGPTSRTTMIVDPAASARLIYALLGSANARLVHQGRSWWADVTGQTLFSDKLTIIDDPLIARGLGSRHFDGEGISARRLPIVENGRVANLYVDTYYGRKTGLAPTTGGGSNRVIGLGEGSLADHLSSCHEGVYVTSWLGGNSDSTTGDFSFGIRGHLIEAGAIGAPVGEMNVSGNLRSLFERLVATGNDPWPYSSALVPTLVFEDVQFSGD